MFKKAIQMRLRFSSTVGKISVEDLYDLPLSQVDVIAQECQKAVENKSTSFIKDVEPVNVEAELRFKIVKEVITDRLAARAAAATAQANAQKKQQLLAILSNKQDEEMASMSAEEIQKLIAEL